MTMNCMSLALRDLPAHASPTLSAQQPSPSRKLSDLALPTNSLDKRPPPPYLISPFSTPRTSTPEPEKVDTSTSHTPCPQLLTTLPQIQCVVRARIPTVTGAEMFLHLYTNNVDDKEHLAIVFGPRIRSRSLDAPRPGESEMDRMIRGAYVGRLHPGRTSSRVDPEPRQTRATRMQDSQSNVQNNDKSRMQDIRNPDGDEDQEMLQVDEENTGRHHEAHQPPLVRIHSECYTGETAWSARCDCGEQLDEAARLMSTPSSSSNPSPPEGVIVYLRQEGRGIGLSEKLKAYNLQDLGNDTVEANLLLRHPADARSYGLATAILVDLGLGRGDDGKGGEEGIRLLTNNPEKIRAVEGPGREVRVRERVAMVPLAWKTGGRRGVKGEEIEGYLRTKMGRMGHLIG